MTEEDEIITVVRTIEYVGPRRWVKATLDQSLKDGENKMGGSMKINVKTEKKQEHAE